MDDNAVIMRPLLSEKTNLARSEGQYYFQVHPKANKIMIKQVLERLFKVKVVRCNILNIKGKKVKTRFGTSFRNNEKKVIVTLKAGDKFPFYEGV